MKRGKEINIILDDEFNVKLGTIDNKTPTTIYLSISSWGEPLNYDIDNNYDMIINNLRKSIKQNTYNLIDEEQFYKNKLIVDLDMKCSGISNKKRSYMNCEITLFQRNNLPITSEPLIKNLTTLFNESILKTLNKNTDFKFYKSKK
jgi:hypothetical protein